jgi:hypothetical protein
LTQHTLEVSDGHGVQARAQRHARDVDQPVHDIELARQRRPRERVADVETPVLDAWRARLGDVGRDHRRALLRQRERLGRALPSRRARHDHDLSV